MPDEENKEIVRVLVEQIINNRKIDLVDELFAPNYVFHIPGFPLMDKQGLKQFLQMLIAAFPDFRESIDDLIVEGEKVAGRFSFHGTHKGEFRGIPPTGKAFSVSVMNILHIDGDKISEQWTVVDLFGLMQQIGVIPKGP
jgi:steroid delta-isomerase-like uncharacterized protein